MKPIAVLYATREGQTRSIAERVAEDAAAMFFEAAGWRPRHANPVAGELSVSALRAGR